MTIDIYTISKKDTAYEAIQEELCMQCKQFRVTVQSHNIMPPAIKNAQKISQAKAQAAYTEAFMPFLKDNAIAIALSLQGRSYDSIQFATFLASLLERTNGVQFFISGAYGFERTFLQHCKTLSLSALTLSHKIAKLVLCEQIYRALSIINAHPYHK